MKVKIKVDTTTGEGEFEIPDTITKEEVDEAISQIEKSESEVAKKDFEKLASTVKEVHDALKVLQKEHNKTVEALKMASDEIRELGGSALPKPEEVELVSKFPLTLLEL